MAFNQCFWPMINGDEQVEKFFGERFSVNPEGSMVRLIPLCKIISVARHDSRMSSESVYLFVKNCLVVTMQPLKFSATIYSR
ncbi:MAG: hypothetical protein JWQ27_1217 [Ferruginibacter sp.]|nr:hypothetical protein [Ferruginibacter sp.]